MFYNSLIQFYNVFTFQNYSLVEIRYLLIRFSKTKFFPLKKRNTDRNGINEQNTHMYNK